MVFSFATDASQRVPIPVTSDDLNQLIRQGETLDVEFVGEEASPCGDDQLLETAVALANRPGDRDGWLLLGVEDDGRVTGARPRHGGFTNPQLVQALLANRTRPALRCEVRSVDGGGGRAVLAILVPASRTPVGTDRGNYLRRGLTAKGKPANYPYHYHEMQARQADCAILDYSALPVPEASWDDLDPLEFERFRRCLRESRGRGEEALLNLSHLDLARTLGAIEVRQDRIQVRVLGLLLFGSEDALRHFLPTHEIALQVLSGTEVKANDFFRWPLLRATDEILQRFRARYREDELLAGNQRIGVPHLPEKAFREAVANALIHRDYARLGAVHVQWQDGLVRISNPGGFPEGVRLDNLLVTSPKPRNPLLAEAFKRAGLVERTARGVDTIFEELLRNGHPPPSYARSTAVDVAADLPQAAPDLAFVRFLLAAGAKAPLGLNELLILHALNGQPRLAVAAAAAVTQLPEAGAAGILDRLAAAGVLTAKAGDGGRKVYHLSQETSRQMERPPVILATQEPAAEEKLELVLNYVREHGRIKREDAASLCVVTPRQASYLLDKLVLAGRLVREGERRGVCYRLPDAAGDPS